MKNTVVELLDGWMDGWDNKVPKDKVALLKVMSHSILGEKNTQKLETQRKKKKNTLLHLHYISFTSSSSPYSSYSFNPPYTV